MVSFFYSALSFKEFSRFKILSHVCHQFFFALLLSKGYYLPQSREAQIRWCLGIYAFCLLENPKVRLCVFHKLITKKRQKIRVADALFLLRGGLFRILPLSLY